MAFPHSHIGRRICYEKRQGLFFANTRQAQIPFTGLYRAYLHHHPAGFLRAVDPEQQGRWFIDKKNPLFTGGVLSASNWLCAYVYQTKKLIRLQPRRRAHSS
jgi:hypothetical protein